MLRTIYQAIVDMSQFGNSVFEDLTSLNIPNDNEIIEFLWNDEESEYLITIYSEGCMIIHV